MAKDRAAPFSRKHRRYWITVTGGMLLIGVINIAIGLCGYEGPPSNPQRIELKIPLRDGQVADAANTLAPSQLPAEVMRAFAIKYPRTIPAGAIVDDNQYIVLFPPGAAHTRATFRADGTFLSDE